MRKIKTLEMEIVLAAYFNYLTNLVIPNVSYGFLTYEADLLVLMKSGWVDEVEIKVSLSDLKADAKKRHTHDSPKLRRLYFAIPEYLVEKGLQYIPEKAGVLVVVDKEYCNYKKEVTIKREVVKLREAKVNKVASKLTTEDQFKLVRLGAIRVWGLKKKLLKEKK